MAKTPVISVTEKKAVVHILANSSISTTALIGGANVGSGAGVYKAKTGNTLQFKTLLAGPNVTISEGVNEITIGANAGGLADVLAISNNAGGLRIEHLGVPVEPHDAARLADIPESLPPSGAAGGDLTGAYPDPVIAPNKVTFDKFQQLPAKSLVGNSLNSTANAGVITIGSGLSLNNGVLEAIGVGGGGNTSASYILFSPDATLPNSRVISGSNGITAFASPGAFNLKLGGTLVESTSISGNNSYPLNFTNLASHSVSVVSAGTISSMVTDVGGFTINSNGLKISDLRVTAHGWEYANDYSAGYTDRSLIDLGYHKTHIVGQDISASLEAPSNSEDGYAIVWDSTNSRFTLASAIGTVTSVQASGGTTGLVFTGGPVTSTGTLLLSGVLLPASGGTGLNSFTAGDILYASSATTLAKLGIGSDGQVLTSQSGVPVWTTPSGGSGGSGHTILDETTPLPARMYLAFQGAGVTATDDSGSDTTIVTIPGAPSYTFANGLSESSGTVALGGALLSNTAITGPYTLQLGTTGSKLSGLSANSSGTISLTATGAISMSADGYVLNGVEAGTASDMLYYDPSTGEITYGQAPTGGGSANISSFASQYFDGDGSTTVFNVAAFGDIIIGLVELGGVVQENGVNVIINNTAKTVTFTTPPDADQRIGVYYFTDLNVGGGGSGGGISDGDKGDITVTSSGTVWTIDNNAVTLGKIAQSTAALSVLGRNIATVGDYLEIIATTPGQVLRVNNDSELGFGTLLSSSFGNNTIAPARLTNAPARSILARTANSSGAPAYVSTTSGSGHVLRESGGTIGWGLVGTSGIANSAVTYAKFQNVAANSFLANTGGSAATVEEVALNRIPLFDSAITGTPDNTTFLRGDGTWATITTGGGGLADGDYGDIVVSGSGSTLTIDNNAVTYAKLQNISTTNRILGRVSSGAGVVQELTGAQVATVLPVFSTTAKGLVPNPGSTNTGKFLRGDGTWVDTPPHTTTLTGHIVGSGTTTISTTINFTGISSGAVLYNNAGSLGGFGTWNGSMLSIPKLALSTAPTNDDTATQILVRDSSTGELKYRNASSIIGGGSGTSLTANANELIKYSSPTSGVGTGVYSSTNGNLILGANNLAGSRIISVQSSAASAGVTIRGKGSATPVLTIGSNNTGAGSLPTSAAFLTLGESTDSTLYRMITTGGVTGNGEVLMLAPRANSAGESKILLTGLSATKYKVSVGPEDGGFTLINDDVTPEAAIIGGKGSKSFILKGGDGVASGEHGAAVSILGGNGATSAGNGSGGSILIRSGQRRAAGTGSDGNITLDSRNGRIILTQTPPNNNTLTQVLMRDGTTGAINYRDVGTIPNQPITLSGAILGSGTTSILTSINFSGIPAGSVLFNNTNSLGGFGDWNGQRLRIASNPPQGNTVSTVLSLYRAAGDTVSTGLGGAIDIDLETPINNTFVTGRLIHRFTDANARTTAWDIKGLHQNSQQTFFSAYPGGVTVGDASSIYAGVRIQSDGGNPNGIWLGFRAKNGGYFFFDTTISQNNRGVQIVPAVGNERTNRISGFDNLDLFGSYVTVSSANGLGIISHAPSPTPVDFKGGRGGLIYLENLSETIKGNPSGGGFLYVEGGALKYRGPSGTITTIAPA